MATVFIKILLSAYCSQVLFLVNCLYIFRIIEWCAKLLADDVATNRKLGDNGMASIVERAMTGLLPDLRLLLLLPF